MHTCMGRGRFHRRDSPFLFSVASASPSSVSLSGGLSPRHHGLPNPPRRCTLTMPHGANSELATTTATANQPDGLTRTPSTYQRDEVGPLPYEAWETRSSSSGPSTALTTSPLSSISGERKICSGGSTSSAE